MESIKKGYIQFVPTCSWCGEKIDGVVDCEEIPEPLVPGCIYKQYEITPPRCSHCGAYFQGIVSPTKLPFEGY